MNPWAGNTSAGLVDRIGRLLSGLRGEVFPADGWKSGLRTIGSDLATLAQSTESEFLSIGERLQHFHQRSSEISRISSTVADLMTGEELGTVIEGFHDVIDRMKQLERESERNTNKLQALTESLSQLDTHVGSFNKDIRRLRILCVSTRIESARLGELESGFENLAAEVGKLSFEIEDRCLKLLAGSGSLARLVGGILSRVRELESTQQDQLRTVLDKTMSSLESLVAKHGQSSAAAERISTSYDGVSRRIGEIVVSLQFHDITRQRIEHAQQALAGLETQGLSVRKRKQRLLMAAEVCSLQIAQLNHAKDELVSATNNILDNLSALADIVEGMTRETSLLAGSADQSGNCSLGDVEAVVSSVAAAFKVYGEADSELSSAMGSVTGMIGDMSAHTGSIESIGENIKRIALNAIVKSNHLGGEGATLGVLAEAIHQLSTETRQRTQVASEALRSINSTSESLCSDVNADETDKGSSLAIVGEALRSQLQTLENVNERIVSLLRRMDVEGGDFSKDIRHTVDGVSAAGQVDRVIGTIVASLEDIVESSRSRTATEGETDRVERLKALEAAYTMQAEREVHRSLLEKQTGPETNPFGEQGAAPAECGPQCATPDSGPGETDEDELGDNVELF